MDFETGLLTRNSEKKGSLLRFSSPKSCSRPNWRRKPRCQSTGDRSEGAWVRESLGSRFGLVVEFGFRCVAFIEASSVQQKVLARHSSNSPQRFFPRPGVIYQFARP